MKTRMKKLISISTIPVLALALLVVLGTVLADDAKKPAPTLTGTSEYDFVGHLQIFDDEGRLLVWEGTISGDIEGTFKWWMVLPMVSTGKVSHYAGRNETWNEGVLLLAIDEAGTTTAPPGKDSIWRTNGIVTEASEEFEDWIGRQTYAEGNVTGDVPDWSGSGTFRIN